MNKKTIIMGSAILIGLSTVVYFTYKGLHEKKANNIAVSHPVVNNLPPIEKTPENTVNPENNQSEKYNIDEQINKYLEDIKKRDNLKQEKLIQILKDDIDGDGKLEIIASFGEDYGSDKGLNKNYLLKVTEKGLKEIKTGIEAGGYYINDLRIVKLDKTKNKYIYAQVTNGAHLLGAEVYGLINNKVVSLFGEASATGAGEYTLVDVNKDGIYDEIVSYRGDYGVYYHQMERHNKWNGKTFELNNIVYSLNDYPKEPEKVIEQYIDTIWLEKIYGANDQTRNRVKEISVNEEIGNVNLSEYTENLYDSAFIVNGESNLKIEKTSKENGFVVGLKNGTIKNKLTFNLKMDNNRWRIESIR